MEAVLMQGLLVTADAGDVIIAARGILSDQRVDAVQCAGGNIGELLGPRRTGSGEAEKEHWSVLHLKDVK